MAQTIHQMLALCKRKDIFRHDLHIAYTGIIYNTTVKPFRTAHHSIQSLFRFVLGSH